jgi:hypothetical protein
MVWRKMGLVNKTVFVVEHYKYQWIPAESASGKRFEFASYHEAFNYLVVTSKLDSEVSYRIVEETRSSKLVYAQMGFEAIVRNVESAHARMPQAATSAEKSGDDEKGRR